MKVYVQLCITVSRIFTMNLQLEICTTLNLNYVQQYLLNLHNINKKHLEEKANVVLLSYFEPYKFM